MIYLGIPFTCLGEDQLHYTSYSDFLFLPIWGHTCYPNPYLSLFNKHWGAEIKSAECLQNISELHCLLAGTSLPKQITSSESNENSTESIPKEGRTTKKACHATHAPQMWQEEGTFSRFYFFMTRLDGRSSSGKVLPEVFWCCIILSFKINNQGFELHPETLTKKNLSGANIWGTYS